jgi:hypothetical protein
MRSSPLLPLAATVLAVAFPGAAHAAAPLGQFGYHVVKATHTSTVTKHDEHYDGTSTATWSLAKASRFTMSWMPGGLFSGLGTVNVKGTYKIDATTDWPGHCAWSASTSDQVHPLSAPAPFDLTASPDPRRPGMAYVAFTTVQASLGNPYMGTECSTAADEPSPKETAGLHLAPARLRSRTITLNFAGRRTGQDGTSTTWKTEIVLRRAARKD